MDKGITWILCEFTKVPPGATLEDERQMGARPYWVSIPPEKLLAVYSKFLNGNEVIFHARISEPVVELDGYEEKVINRVRVLNREPINDENEKIIGFKPATFQVLEEENYKDERGNQATRWNVVDEGPISIDIIPLVPIVLGKRDGTSWRVSPPLRDLAYMQNIGGLQVALDCSSDSSECGWHCMSQFDTSRFYTLQSNNERKNQGPSKISLGSVIFELYFCRY